MWAGRIKLSLGAANMAASPAETEPSWLDRWSSRTGPATRLTLFTTIGGTLTAWLLGITQQLANCPLYTVQHWEFFRLITSWIVQGSLLGFVFFVLSFGQAGPKAELTIGTLPMLYLILCVSFMCSAGHTIACELLNLAYEVCVPHHAEANALHKIKLTGFTGVLLYGRMATFIGTHFY